MTVHWIKATKKKRVCQWRIHREFVFTVTLQEDEIRGFRFVGNKRENLLVGLVFSGCLKQVRAPLEEPSTRVSACCSSPLLLSWTGRSGVGWSPSPGRTISHNTLRHRCCPQRKAEGKEEIFNFGGNNVQEWYECNVASSLKPSVWLLPLSFGRKPCRWAASRIRPDAAARSSSTPAGLRLPAGLPAQTK